MRIGEVDNLRVFIFFIVIFSNNALASDVSPDRIKEIAVRNLPAKPIHFVGLCDAADNLEWCKGYYSALIISLMNQGVKLCLPSNEVNRYIFDGTWSITKAWLYKQPKNEEVTFFEAVGTSLSEDANCE